MALFDHGYLLASLVAAGVILLAMTVYAALRLRSAERRLDALEIGRRHR
jgi:hypothetical protein